jgi:type IV pilus assembly protein PilO
MKIQLTKDQITKIAAGLVFGGLFIYAYLVYFWLPVSKKISTSSKKVEEMTSNIEKAKREKAKYKDLNLKLESLKIEKENAQKKLPTSKKIPELIRSLIDFAKKYNITIQTISPQGSRREEYFVKELYSINIKGDYHSLGRFLTALGLEERIFTVENLIITGTPGAETSTITATFILVAYQYSG